MADDEILAGISGFSSGIRDVLVPFLQGRLEEKRQRRILQERGVAQRGLAEFESGLTEKREAAKLEREQPIKLAEFEREQEAKLIELSEPLAKKIGLTPGKYRSEIIDTAIKQRQLETPRVIKHETTQKELKAPTVKGFEMTQKDATSALVTQLNAYHNKMLAGQKIDPNDVILDVTDKFKKADFQDERVVNIIKQITSLAPEKEKSVWERVKSFFGKEEEPKQKLDQLNLGLDLEDFE